ncbi:hypothetical protein T265_02162 [Opisthorchis viverrini]|uniref:BHLH domain-containing protein n=1 Tax=Opisthorchis viverrini TaxID=6198 RepID=A0A074ZX62_OPIVI|nr:hypothetical protein T265_02162 [Opisthorchis viverrini]KER31656.1 hypothetical protein T265_02162 [Opisthorchis viverrini]
MSPSTLHKRRIGSKSGKRSTDCRRSSRLRWIECERLKEIVPSVAGAECVNEVKVIKEAIKHISRLEEAVIQRLVSCDSEMLPVRTNITGSVSHNFLSDRLLALLMHRQTEPTHLPLSQLHQSSGSIFWLPQPFHFSSSSASTPCCTDEEDHMNQCV